MAIQQDQLWILEVSMFVTLVLIAVHILSLILRKSEEKRQTIKANPTYDFEVGDNVLMRSSEKKKPPKVARVESIETDVKGNAKVRVRWYYRPEESKGGRRQFHGIKELFLSDHYDTQSANTIEGKCIVHSFKSYTKLKDVGLKDYFCRFEYKAATGEFTPDRVAVYCKCEMPKNPDDFMVRCEACKDWYHPACLNMTIKQAKQLESFTCYECLSLEGNKRPSKRSSASTLANSKLRPWRTTGTPKDVI